VLSDRPRLAAIKQPEPANFRARYVGMLRGSGLEIGALHSPTILPPGTTVRYVDQYSLEELRATYTEVSADSIVAPDIVADSHDLAPVASESVDFVVASHVIEHLHNPIAGLLEWQRVLRPGGLALLIVPDGRYTFDVGRPFTSLDHLLWDYANDGTELKKLNDVLHAAECALNKYEHFDAYSALENGRLVIDTTYDTHFHVWSFESFVSHLRSLIDDFGLPFTIAEAESDGGFEMIVVLEASAGHGAFSVEGKGIPRAAR
jgi:SAM-dependent methyltransferase